VGSTLLVVVTPAPREEPHRAGAPPEDRRPQDLISAIWSTHLPRRHA
jgi:hypothetical protein